MAKDDSSEVLSLNVKLVRHVLQLLCDLSEKILRKQQDVCDADHRDALTFLNASAYSLTRRLGDLQSSSHIELMAFIVDDLADRLEKDCFHDNVLRFSKVPELHPLYPRLHAIKYYLSTTSAREPLTAVGYFCKALKTFESCKKLKEDLSKVDLDLDLDQDSWNDNDYDVTADPLPAMGYDENVYGCLKNTFDAIVCACSSRIPQEIRLRIGMLASAHDNDDRALDILALSNTSSFWQEVTVHVSIHDSNPRLPKGEATKPWAEKQPRRFSCMCFYSRQSEKVFSSFTDHVVLEINEDGVSWSRHKQDLRNHRFHEHSTLAGLYGFFRYAHVSRLIIAAQIAASLCYLHRGPWLDNRWSRDNVVFFDNRGRIPCQPYLRVSLPSGAFVDEENPTDNLHPYPHLLELGIMLLELEIGMSIEDYMDYPSPLPDLDTKLAVARKVFEKRQAQILLDSYKRAIQFCLKPDFDDIEDDPESERMAIFRHVFLVLGKAILDLNIIKSLRELDHIPNKYDIQTQAASFVREHGQHCVTETSPESGPRREIPTPLYPHEELDDEFDLFASETEAQGSSFDNNTTDKWIEKFKALVEKVQQHNPDEVVKVALLDTGIDVHHTDFAGDDKMGRIKCIQSWVDDKQGENCHMDGDESGHGTFIASLLLDLAPNIHLYVARVTKARRVKRGSGDLNHIASALEYARTIWKVDVISMSFGFPKGISKIGEEVRKAYRADILVFAAASNDGAHQSRAFPAREEGVFAIHSTDGHGVASRYNPTAEPDGPNFCILGDYIESAWPNKKTAGMSRRLSGTSFATPIAVCLAAFFLTHVPRQVGDLAGYCHHPKSYAGMKRLFLMIKEERDPSYYLISPIKFFQENNETFIREQIKKALAR